MSEIKVGEIEKLNTQREENYKLMLSVIAAEINEEKNLIANLSNISSIINFYMDDISWVGFYFLRNEELVVGPFQGMPACTRIKLGIGVCGTAAKNKITQRVMNVHNFPGHIACDSRSNSEIVVPIFVSKELVGVLDLDSISFGRFTELEQLYLEKSIKLIEKCQW